MITLLINANYIKEFTNVDESVTEKVINIAIQDSQIALEETIGTNLYTRVINSIITNVFTTDVTNLLNDYIIPYLGKLTEYNVAQNVFVKIRQKGIVTVDDEGSKTNSGDTLKILNANILKNVDALQRKLVRYLEVNYKLYPEYSYYMNLITPNDKPIGASIIFPTAIKSRQNQNYSTIIQNPFPYNREIELDNNLK